MTVRIMGIHDGHGASAALLEDGHLVFAIQEERLTRVKNQGGLPIQAMQEVLNQTGLNMSDIDFFALNGNYMVHPKQHHEAIAREYSQSALSVKGKGERRVKQLLKNVPPIDSFYKGLMQKNRLKALASIGVPGSNVVPVEHHLAHGACAYYGWGRMDEDILVLTCDGMGDRLSGSVSIGRGGRLDRVASVREEDSIGLLYSLVTFLMGMVPLEHEYKVMGLAPYALADQKHVERLYHKFADLFDLDPNEPMVWRRRRGVPSILSASGLIHSLMRCERFDWVAAGLQRFVETFMSAWVRRCVQETGIGRVALAGGVFMNVKLNQRILELSEVDELYVYPSCSDETASFGAAYWVHANQGNGSARSVKPLGHMYLGGEFTDECVEKSISSFEFDGSVSIEHYDNIERRTAELMASGEVVARSKGRMEFGARALGNRSILADPRSTEVVRTINDMIKQRDFWMPFAASVQAEKAEQYYVKPKPMPAPYMIVTFDSRPEKRDSFVAATHPYDGTTRPQEVTSEWNPDYHNLLKHYESLTGECIVLNTSFNLHGFPIVYTPEDALEVLHQSGLKHLAVGNFLVSKKNGSRQR